MKKIQLENIHKHFNGKKVLQGVNLSVNAGESLVIIGGSGSGKSVLLKILLGLIKADQGKIIVDGELLPSSVRSAPREKFLNKIGMLFQGGALFDSLTVWENISFVLLQHLHYSKAKAKEVAIEKLAMVGLDKSVANLYPAELSGGMQKRVALARAIVREPEVILFDEPTTGLDPIMSDVINNLIVDCSKKLGATTITITHDMASVNKIADKVAMLYQGNIIWQGQKDQLHSSDNPYVEQFVKGVSEGPITIL